MHPKLNKLFPVSLKSTFLTLFVMVFAVLFSLLIEELTGIDEPITTVFVLAVLIISRFTEGYLYGTASSVIGVICVNLLFSYPNIKFDFSTAGYPLIFTTLFSVSLITSTLTARIKIISRRQVENEKEKMRANLLRSVSHDLRTPLTSISGAANVLLKNGEDMESEKKKELLEDISDSADWLLRVMENILSVTRVGAVDAKITKKDEMLEEVVSAAVARFHKTNPDVTVSASVPDEVVTVPMDAILIEQVFLNLMQNSVIHGACTKIEVNIRYAGTDAEISVADNGTGLNEGMDEDFIPKYLRDLGVDSPVADSDTKGFGIGLSVCKTIVVAHGGTIRASNRSEGGALFVFTLPMK